MKERRNNSIKERTEIMSGEFLKTDDDLTQIKPTKDVMDVEPEPQRSMSLWVWTSIGIAAVFIFGFGYAITAIFFIW
ncbi:MAG: hypothetical protein RLY66_509 [Candidatus Parcubacteria bacterium]